VGRVQSRDRRDVSNRNTGHFADCLDPGLLVAGLVTNAVMVALSTLAAAANAGPCVAFNVAIGRDVSNRNTGDLAGWLECRNLVGWGLPGVLPALPGQPSAAQRSRTHASGSVWRSS